MKAISNVTEINKGKTILLKGEVFNVLEEDNYTFQRTIIKISNERIQGLWANKEDFNIVN